MGLDRKSQDSLINLRARVESGAFSEEDARSMLILLRQLKQLEQKPLISTLAPLRELADGIAHATRDRGEFFKRLEANYLTLKRLATSGGVLNGNPVIHAGNFETAVNEALVYADLAPLATAVCENLLLCSLSVLQSAAFTHKTDADFEGQLSFAMLNDEYELWASIPARATNGAKVNFTFCVAAVPNRHNAICNPRARIEAQDVVTVRIADSKAVVEGFPSFKVYLQRHGEAIQPADLRGALFTFSGFRQVGDNSFLATPDGHPGMPITLEGGKLVIPGRPEFFRRRSPYVGFIQTLAAMTRSIVLDDSNANWFRHDVLLRSPDEFDCVWFYADGSVSVTPRTLVQKSADPKPATAA